MARRDNDFELIRHEAPSWETEPRRSFVGRSTKYDEHVHNVVVEATRRGNRRAQVARLAGVQLRTLQTWLSRGRENLERIEQDDGAELEQYDADLARLAYDVDMAEAEWEDELLGIIREAAHYEWTAAMTWLERRFPQHYGRRDTTVLEGGERPLIEITVGDPETMALANRVLRELARPLPAIEGEVVAED